MVGPEKTLVDAPVESTGEGLLAEAKELSQKGDFAQAAVLWADQKILAILIPREKGTITMLRGIYDQFTYSSNSEEKEHYVATTMEHITRKCSGNLLPLDVTETKPEGLPDILWRFWIRQRIMFADKNIR